MSNWNITFKNIWNAYLIWFIVVQQITNYLSKVNDFQKPCRPSLFLYFLWANPCLFLFIFVLFKHNFYRKKLGLRGVRTRIVRVEGWQLDHHHAPIYCIFGRFNFTLFLNSPFAISLLLHFHCFFLLFGASSLEDRKCVTKSSLFKWPKMSEVYLICAVPVR